jgi:DNA-binding transcriptional MerR regulator
VTVLLTIGEFSRMTHLSVKALRHYHDVGVLEPAAVDPTSSYRRYSASQVPTAQLIRRLRDLDMPLDEVRVVLDAPDDAARNRAILTHLERMEDHLAQTRATVASLRALLADPTAPAVIEHRTVMPMRSLAIRGTVRMDDSERWLTSAYDEIDGLLSRTHTEPVAAAGALYPREFFELEAGRVTAFVPVLGEPATAGRVELLDLPAGELAVMLHEGPFSDLDRTYGALGTYVAERNIGAEGAIREHYLVTETHTPDPAQHRTEVCWPIATEATLSPTTNGVIP